MFCIHIYCVLSMQCWTLNWLHVCCSALFWLELVACHIHCTPGSVHRWSNCQCWLGHRQTDSTHDTERIQGQHSANHCSQVRCLWRQLCPFSHATDQTADIDPFLLWPFYPHIHCSSTVFWIDEIPKQLFFFAETMFFVDCSEQPIWEKFTCQKMALWYIKQLRYGVLKFKSLIRAGSCG